MRQALLLLTILLLNAALRGEEPAAAVAVIAKPELSAEEIQKYITQLGHEEFALRAVAYETLLACGEKALPAIRAALKDSQDAELKPVLSKLEAMCDNGSQIVGGLSVKMMLNKTEIGHHDFFTVTLRFINHNRYPMVVPLGLKFFSSYLIQIEDRTEPLSWIAFPNTIFGSAGSFCFFAEIPALDYFEKSLQFRVALVSHPIYPETNAAEYQLGKQALPIQSLTPSPGKHTYRLCCHALQFDDNNRIPKYQGFDGWFKSNAYCWKGTLYTNDVSIKVVR